MHNLSDHHHSSVIKWVYIVSIIVSTLAAINVGLAQFNYNLMDMIAGPNAMPWLAAPLAYFVGICGIIGLIMIVICAIQCCSTNHR